ncbi:MAG: hypothetical protein AAF391_02015 [Bacteroidota bacterium]
MITKIISLRSVADAQRMMYEHHFNRAIAICGLIFLVLTFLLEFSVFVSNGYSFLETYPDAIALMIEDRGWLRFLGLSFLIIMVLLIFYSSQRYWLRNAEENRDRKMIIQMLITLCLATYYYWPMPKGTQVIGALWGTDVLMYQYTLEFIALLSNPFIFIERGLLRDLGVIAGALYVLTLMILYISVYRQRLANKG